MEDKETRFAPELPQASGELDLLPVSRSSLIFLNDLVMKLEPELEVELDVELVEMLSEEAWFMAARIELDDKDIDSGDGDGGDVRYVSGLCVLGSYGGEVGDGEGWLYSLIFSQTSPVYFGSSHRRGNFRDVCFDSLTRQRTIAFSLFFLLIFS
jgi:hypothetical protein